MNVKKFCFFKCFLSVVRYQARKLCLEKGNLKCIYLFLNKIHTVCEYQKKQKLIISWIKSFNEDMVSVVLKQ